jgi:hypothetical protein
MKKYNDGKPDCNDAVAAAIRWLTHRNIPFSQPHPRQLKIRDINFYPTTGTITRDGAAGRCREKGLSGLEVVLGQSEFKSVLSIAV